MEKDLPRACLVALLQAADRRCFEAGQVVFEEGEIGDSFWLVRQGTFELVKSFFGERHRLTCVSRGGMLGENNLFDDSARTATVQALTEGRAYRLPNQRLRQVLEEFPMLALGILKAFAARSAAVEQQLVEHLVQSNFELKMQNARLESKIRQRTRHLEASNRDLKQMAWTDPLTGCNNRRALDAVLSDFCSGDSPFAVALFDVDHFKQYNDRHGHLEGDRALKTLVRLLKRRLRPDDLLARYGGEEFCLVLRDVDGPTATRVCERLRQSITDFAFPHEHQQPLGDFTVSMGLAMYPQAGDRPEVLLEAADQKLYEAKSQGRNRLVGGVAN